MNTSKQEFVSPGVEEDELSVLSAKLLKATDELTQANIKLKEAEKERSEMLANISHDLRAPITAIRSALDLLNSLKEIDIDTLHSTVKLIDRRTATLENLIQDMYFLFCVEDDNREFNFQSVPAGPFLEEYFYDAITDTRYDNHDMRLDVPMDLDCVINIDVQKMIRVLDNLFTNAAKYSGEDTQITLKAEASNDTLIISVSDNGIGIPEESLPLIFGRTYTVSNARTPGSATGSGLGLAIVKAVVEKHGGNVMCESTFGEGSRFIIKLPVVEN